MADPSVRRRPMHPIVEASLREGWDTDPFGPLPFDDYVDSGRYAVRVEMVVSEATRCPICGHHPEFGLTPHGRSYLHCCDIETDPEVSDWDTVDKWSSCGRVHRE